jgi:hypothetical protein
MGWRELARLLVFDSEGTRKGTPMNARTRLNLLFSLSAFFALAARVHADTPVPTPHHAANAPTVGVTP